MLPYNLSLVTWKNINYTGKYMESLFTIKDQDSFVKQYYNMRENTGPAQLQILVSNILNAKPDFNNEIHKQIIVLEFSY